VKVLKDIQSNDNSARVSSRNRQRRESPLPPKLEIKEKREEISPLSSNEGNKLVTMIKD
jgi:hypothetical protein